MSVPALCIVEANKWAHKVIFRFRAWPLEIIIVDFWLRFAAAPNNAKIHLFAWVEWQTGNTEFQLELACQKKRSNVIITMMFNFCCTTYLCGCVCCCHGCDTTPKLSMGQQNRTVCRPQSGKIVSVICLIPCNFLDSSFRIVIVVVTIHGLFATNKLCQNQMPKNSTESLQHNQANM